MRHWLAYGLLAAALFTAAGAAHAQEAVTVRLEYRDDGFDVPLHIRPDAEVRFREAPSSVQGFAVSTGAGQKDIVALGVDEAHQAVYVDLNRNFDLTDDPGAIVTYPPTPLNAIAQFDAHITGTAPVPRRYHLELGIGPIQADSPVQLRMRSGWEGSIWLGGETWTVAVMDNLDGVITEVPPVDPADPFFLGDMLLIYRDRGYDPDPWTRGVLYGGSATRNLWLNGRHYKVDYAFQPDGEKGALEVSFGEIPVAKTGSIKVAGKGVQRLILTGPGNGPETVVLDAPSGTVSVPAARYWKQEIRLYDTARKLCYQSVRSEPVYVEPGSAKPLNVGGPLDNHILVKHGVSRLSLDYALVGAGGEAYKCLNPPNRRPDTTLPHYAAYFKGEKVLSGQFEYG